MARRAVGASRFLILIAVICLFVCAVALVLYTGAETFIAIAGAFSTPISAKGAKQLALTFIELTDLFLLATVIYITAAGLYELFIDDNIPLLPDWLIIHTLDDLKNKLVGVVVVVLAVLFLGQIVSWDGERDLLGYGGAVALMIAALTYFLSQQPKKPSDKS